VQESAQTDFYEPEKESYLDENIPILILENLIFAVNGVIWAITVSEGLTFIVGLTLWMVLLKTSAKQRQT
jgi:hypothetical protein